MKLLLTTLLFCTAVLAQDPQDGPKPAPKPEPAPKSEVQEPKQEPKPQGKQGQPKQEPQPGPKADGGTQDPKPADGEKPKAGGDDAPQQEPRVDRPGKAQPMPKGTDPADIAAMRSAEAMLAAERKLAQQIKEGKIAGLDKILTFDEISSWPYEDGLKGMPQRVKELSGRRVLMTGFMLPIDEVQNIKEFLLVESLWSCCYGQPPDIHGIVRVVMPKGKPTDYFFDPLKIIGTFKVEATMMDGYCVDIYQLHVEALK